VKRFYYLKCIANKRQVVLVAVLVSVFINRFAKEKASQVVENTGRMKVNADDFRQKEEDWLMRCPVDDDFGKLSRTL